MMIIANQNQYLIEQINCDSRVEIDQKSIVRDMAVKNTLLVTTSLAASLLALVISNFGGLLVGINSALFFICAEKLRREWSLR